MRNSILERERARDRPARALQNLDQIQDSLAALLQVFLAAEEHHVLARWPPRHVGEVLRPPARASRSRLVVGRHAPEVGWQRARGSAARVLLHSI